MVRPLPPVASKVAIAKHWDSNELNRLGLDPVDAKSFWPKSPTRSLTFRSTPMLIIGGGFVSSSESLLTAYGSSSASAIISQLVCDSECYFRNLCGQLGSSELSNSNNTPTRTLQRNQCIEDGGEMASEYFNSRPLLPPRSYFCFIIGPRCLHFRRPVVQTAQMCATYANGQ